LTENQ